MKMTRREAIKTAVLAGGALAAPGLLTRVRGEAAAGSASPAPEPTGPFKVPPLPYGYDALEPYIDTETMHIHHDKHHAAYVKKLNEAVATKPELIAMPLERMLESLNEIGEPLRKAIRNQGGGHYNHSLFWQMMKPGGGEPKGPLADAITGKFGSFGNFKTAFSKEAAGVFGSGWAWLVVNGKELEIDSTPNQDTPISEWKVPVLGLDVWEHAYYLKRQNRRPEYIEAWWNVVNWDFASSQYAKALG